MQSAQARKLWPLFQKLSGYIHQVYDRIDHKHGKLKETMDFVHRCEETVEELIKEELAELTPEVPVYSEGEVSTVDELPEEAWVIDPIDGTTNFFYKIPVFAISLAYYEDKKLTKSYVYDVMNDVYYHAQTGSGSYANQKRLRLTEASSECVIIRERRAFLPQKWYDNQRVHIRSIGSLSLGMCWLAESKAHLFLSGSVRLTDIAGAWLIVQEAGGIIKELDQSMDSGSQSGIIAAHPGMVGKFLAELR